MLKPRYHASESRITHINLVVLPALSAEPKEDPRANDIDVPRAKCGQPERSVLARVLAVANTHEGLIQDSHGRREHSFAWDAWPRQISVDAFADPWEGFREVDQSVIFRLVADLSPALVIAVLLSAPSIAPGGLDVTDRARRDPHIGPRRRDRESSDSFELALVADRDAVAVGVDEPAPVPPAANAGLVVVRVAQPRELRARCAVARDLVAHDERLSSPLTNRDRECRPLLALLIGQHATERQRRFPGCIDFVTPA